MPWIFIEIVKSCDGYGRFSVKVTERCRYRTLDDCMWTAILLEVDGIFPVVCDRTMSDTKTAYGGRV
jgi:hypothetical protein